MHPIKTCQGGMGNGDTHANAGRAQLLTLQKRVMDRCRIKAKLSRSYICDDLQGLTLRIYADIAIDTVAIQQTRQKHNKSSMRGVIVLQPPGLPGRH
jgi:hypothetical protein